MSFLHVVKQVQLPPTDQTAWHDALAAAAQVVRSTDPSLVLELTADVHAPRTARRAVNELACRFGASRDELDTIRTLVSEGVSNAVTHAYDGEPGPVCVEAAVIGGDLTILISDEGRGPRCGSPNPGLGLGWKLVAQLTDGWAVIQRGSGGTTLYMKIALAAGRSVGDPAQI